MDEKKLFRFSFQHGGIYSELNKEIEKVLVVFLKTFTKVFMA
jgi:hypothetical protein